MQTFRAVFPWLALVALAPNASGSGTVTNCDQAGLLAGLSGGGKVALACDGTITLTNTITISTDTVLDGAGHSVVISGNNAVRLFNVSTGATFTLLNLTLANGQHQGTNGAAGMNGGPGFGGAIFNAGGTVNIVSSLLTNNAAIGGDASGTLSGGAHAGAGFGGAIYNQSGHVAITNSTLAANLAGGGFLVAGSVLLGAEAFGGAICNLDGSVSLVNVFISGNSAVGGGDANAPNGQSGSAFGGAVFASGGNVFTSNVTFHANRALVTRLPFNGQAGSACGGALYISNSVTTLLRGVLATNAASGGFVGRGGRGGLTQGGAIYNQGQLLLRETLLAGNRADGGFGGGGGGEGEGGALYTVNSAIIDACAFADNTARGGDGGATSIIVAPGGHGGGGAIYAAGMLSITNSTLAFNRAVGGDAGFNVLGAKQRGGDGIGGGIWGSAGSLSLTHLTLAGNTASGGAGTRLAAPPGPDGVGNGGGIFNTNGAMTLVNTIIANSLSGSNCFGIITDGGGNISSDGSCSFSAPGSLNNTDPVLGLLGDYGGPTPTIPLLAGSPAIDRANTAFCPSSDQRGRTRPSGTGCDIGALESSPPYTIRGQITGFGISGGIEVKLNTSSTVTDNDRNYALNDFAPATYTVLPVSSELVFIPHDRVITVGPDSVANDFKAYRLNYLSSEPSSNAIQHCVFAGTNGQAHEIQVSTNLVNWLPIATNTVDARGIFEYFYTNSATDRMRFLRTKKQP